MKKIKLLGLMPMKRVVKIVLGILLLLIVLFAAALLILPGIQNETIHKKAVAWVQEEFDGAVTFNDFSLSYLRSFPHVSIELTNVKVWDKGQEMISAGKVQTVLNLRKYFQNKLEIEKFIVEQAHLSMVIDSAGNKPALFAKKENSGSGLKLNTHVESGHLVVKNSTLYFANHVKKNRTYISVEQADLHLEFEDSLYRITGGLTGALDTLISNNTTLFKGQPVKAHDVSFSINPETGTKKLDNGYLLAHTLKLLPRLSMSPHDDGQLVELHISGDGNFNDFLDLFEFHVGLDLEQTNPQAELSMSYNQEGFVNPFERPYSELDFTIRQAEFRGQDLPYPIENLTISGNYNNGPGHSPETVELVIDTLTAQVEGSYIDARFKLINLRDPIIDARLMARLDLSHLVKPSKDIQLKGMVEADLAVNGRLSELQAMHLEGKQLAQGNIDVKDLELVLNQQGVTLELINGSSLLNNHVLEVTSLVGAFNRSAFHFQGQFKNLEQAILAGKEDVGGSFRLNFNELDLTAFDFNQFKREKTEKSSGILLSLFAFDFYINGNTIITPYGPVKDIVLDCRLDNNSLTISNMSLKYQEGSLQGTAGLEFENSGIKSLKADLSGDFESLMLTFPSSQESEPESKTSFAWPRSIDARLDLKIKNGEVQDLDFSNFHLLAAMKDDMIHIQTFRANLWDGNATVAGKVKINESGLGGLWLKGDMSFNHVDLDELMGQGGGNHKVGMPVFPEDVALDLQVKSKRVSYRDLALANFRAGIKADRQLLQLEDFYVDLPFGSVALDATLDEYRKQSPEITSIVKLQIDSLNVEEIMQSEAYTAIAGVEGTKGSEKSGGNIANVLPGNADIRLSTQAHYINYQGIVLENVVLSGEMDKDGINLEKMTLDFANGNLELNGHIDRLQDGRYAGYAYSRGNEIDIQEVFRTFNNFNQDQFTDKNTLGTFSTASHYYFMFDENMEFITDENLWLLNLFVNHLELDEVEPIEKTLFFVGHKSKDKMIVHELNLNAYVIADKIYFRDIYMNDNIADLGVFGVVDTKEMEMDLALEVSLTDLFFRSRSRRMDKTDQGLYSLDKDSKLFLQLDGPLKDHKMKLISKSKFSKQWDALDAHIKKTTLTFRDKNEQRKPD